MSELILVTLPIGNNKDLTFRAKSILQNESYIFAEDTRVFRDFCKHNDIGLENKKIESFHDHTEDFKLEKIIELLSSQNIVLVSDAGSPVISDPAYPLIQAAINNNIQIQSIPGVSSIVVALELSGLPPVPFQFHAFIPREKGKKEKFTSQISSTYGTHIFFEGVSRVEATLDQMTKLLPDFDFCLTRELTKEYQSVHRFKGSEWLNVKNNVVYKGEFVILVHNANQNYSGADSSVKDIAQELLDGGVHPKKLSKLLAKILDISPKDAYTKLQK